MIFVKIVTKIKNKYKNYIRYRKLRRKLQKPRDLHTKYLLLLYANRNYPFVTTFYHSNTNFCCNSMQIENALMLPHLPHFTTATANFCCNSEQIETIVLLPLLPVFTTAKPIFAATLCKQRLCFSYHIYQIFITATASCLSKC